MVTIQEFKRPKVTLRAFRFFREHAGGVVGRSAVTAYCLARAERYASEHGWKLEWQLDPEPYELGDAETRMPTEVLGCVLRDDDGNVLGSLWGIGDPSPEYAHVVQAELASEALFDIEAAARHDALAHTFQAL